MTGFKTFANGEVLEAADVNNYLMRQSLMRVANHTERGTITSPAEGMLIYCGTHDAFEVYDGAAWITFAAKGLNALVAVIPDVVGGTLNVSSYTSTGNVSTTFYWGQFDVPYGVTFSETPAFNIDCTTAGAVAWCQVLSVSTTQATVRVIRAAGVMGTLDFRWSAVGDR
jgi:hypothetical protein